MKTKTTFLITSLALAGFAQISSAVPVFPSSPGLYIYDEATGTGQAVASVGGIANFVGTVGDYTVSVSGITDSRGSAPFLDLDVALAIANTGATRLDVFYSDGPFGSTSGSYLLQTTGPAAGGPIVTSAYLDTTVFGQKTFLGGSTDVFPFTVNATGSFRCPSYYLTLEDSITGSESSVDSSFRTTPDGGSTVILLGLALSGVGLLRKKFAS